MDNRLKLMAEHGARNIAEFNSHKDKDIDNLPYVVIVIDELADVMAKSGKDVDRLISLIAAKARAAGIHLVLATQTPRVNIITGTIKANIPARIAFTTTNNIDSQTILGTGGAEKLLGNGDMLFVSAEDGRPRRVQGVYVSNSEVTAVTSFLKDQRKPQYDPAILAASNSESGGGAGGGQETMTDELWQQAAEIVISNNKGSSSLLQRRLSVGYSRAAKIIDILEQKGVLGPQVGNKPREVIVSSLDDVIEVPEAPQ
jgi:S-DNA-T family DNA segregation ATPase FtsK/SpoIIIE